MAKLMNKYNNTRKFTYEAPENHPFMSLAELSAFHGTDASYILRGLYINKKSRYGDAPVAITDFAFVNLPKHLVSTVEDMINDREVVEAINNGEVGFMVEEYIPRNYPDRKAFSVTWIDIE